jgi:uncharacterized protein (DUF1501 family)
MNEQNAELLGQGQDELCGCSDNRRTSISRRSLLAGAGALAATAGWTQTFGSAVSQYAYAETGYTGDTVVVLSLRGGFDGLSAIAPVADPNYLKARPTIGLTAAKALQLDSTFGLHPALAPLKPLWDKGQLAAVHAVGQPNPTRSHFAAMEAMENAAPGSTVRTGWLDRLVGLTPPDPFGSVALGSASAPSAMMGPNPELAIKSIDAFALSGSTTAADLARWTPALLALQEGAPASVTGAAKSTLDSLVTLDQLRATTYTPANGAVYPSSDLGKALKDLARLIKAGKGIRAAAIDVGNWDMHVGLGKLDSGWMFSQLTDLAKSMAAFATDLGSKMSDVTVVTLSEFGRRLKENGSGGLDHGHGNLSLVLSGGVIGGKVYGTWPGLAESALVDGDLAGTTDYRKILAEILEKRAKLSSTTVFPQLETARLGMFRARA